MVINFQRLINPEIIPKELLQSGEIQRERGAVPEATGTDFFRGDDKQNRGTFPMPTSAGRPSTIISLIPVEFPHNSLVGQQRQMSELQFDKFPNPKSFLVWRIRFKNQVIACSDFPSKAMLRIGEVEMVDSVVELNSSRSVSGKNFQNFELLDARIASALNKIIQNSHFKKKVSLEEQKAQKEDWFLRGRQIAFKIYDFFPVTDAHDTVLDYDDWFSVPLF